MSQNGVKPDEADEPDVKALREQYLAHVRAVYPGLQCFVSMFRTMETGDTHFMFFDLALDPSEPIHVLLLHPRDLLVGGDGFTMPALTYAQYEHMRATGEPPPGYILANYGASEEPSR